MSRPLRAPHRCAGAVVLLPAIVWACGREPEQPAPPVIDLASAPTPPYPLTDVVLAKVRQLESELALPEPPEPAETEHVQGLLSTAVSSDRSLSQLAVEEAVGLGDACLPELEACLAQPQTEQAQRLVALRILGEIGTVRAAALLLRTLETGEPAIVRAHAAWHLSRTEQDWIVPRALLRLKYEEDHETVIWIGRALTSQGNYTGLVGLEIVGRTSPSPELRATALAQLEEIAREIPPEDEGGEGTGEPWTGYALLDAWREGAPLDAFSPERSPRYDLEVWRLLARFVEFQLRGVDDSRYVLEGLGPRAAELMAQALRDRSVYVRVHTAQGLQRMGPRARPAGPALLAALEDPELAAQAAAALGAIRFQPALPALVEALGPDTAPDLRLAATRALGGYGDEASEEARSALERLRAEGRATELRQAAAESLVLTGLEDTEFAAPALTDLLDFLTADGVEPASTERVLRAWLAAREASDVLAAWDALQPPTDRIVSTEERRAAGRARRELLEETFGGP